MNLLILVAHRKTLGTAYICLISVKSVLKSFCKIRLFRHAIISNLKILSHLFFLLSTALLILHTQAPLCKHDTCDSTGFLVSVSPSLVPVFFHTFLYSSVLQVFFDTVCGDRGRWKCKHLTV